VAGYFHRTLKVQIKDIVKDRNARKNAAVYGKRKNEPRTDPIVKIKKTPRELGHRGTKVIGENTVKITKITGKRTDNYRENGIKKEKNFKACLTL